MLGHWTQPEANEESLNERSGRNIANLYPGEVLNHLLSGIISSISLHDMPSYLAFSSHKDK